MRKLTALSLCLALGGCAVAAQIDSRQDYQASAAAYKRCLTSNPPQACEGQRLAMETDERKYNNLTAGLSPDGQRSGSLTILNR
jgi:hypothetical protein